MRSSEGAFGLVSAGGPVVIVLLVLSVVALTIVLVKLAQFASVGLGRSSAVDEALALARAGDAERALAAAEGGKGLQARTVALALRGRMRSDLPEASVREEVERYALREVETLRGQLGFLELIGQIAPLLGLLGTVLGMIEAFQAMEDAGRNVDPAVLSGGIWVALLTTAVGLGVAIPVVAAVNWLDRVVTASAHRVEDAVTRVFAPDLSGEAR